MQSSASRPTGIHPICVYARQKSSGGRRPKKKVYHRDHELDRVMELRKKPTLILQLKSIIQSQKHQSLLLRDLEKEVGFVQKWNFMSAIEKYPSVFRVTGVSNGRPPSVALTDRAQNIASEEANYRELMEPILVRNLKKLLMLTVDCRIPLSKIRLVESELGLPIDFKNTLIPKYPQFFSIKSVNGKDCIQLEHWDSRLAITSREEAIALAGPLPQDFNPKKIKISKDGNFAGPFAFKMKYPAGFRPNMSYLEEVERWQRLEFPSPYLNARRFEYANPNARKRVVAVLHELLSLTMEKRLTCAKIDAFNAELLLPLRLVVCLVKHQGIFYITNKGERGTVFLKDAYNGSNLIDKYPMILFNEKFMELTGRKDTCIHSGTTLPVL